MKKYPQLVSSALALFYRQGFHATGVEQLASDGGLSKKTLYRYFPTKEALIEATLQLRDEDFIAQLQTALAPLAAGDRPAAYLAFLWHWFASDGFHGCLFINAAAEYPQRQDAIHQQAAAHKRRLRDYLLALCREANLVNAERCAHQLFLLGEGLTVSAQVDGMDVALLNAAQAQLADW